jgi:transposase
MSAAYIKGVREHLSGAQIVFDHFHLMMLAGVALDKVRRALARDGADLKGGLWALRGNEWTRSPEQLKLRRRLCNAYRPLARAMGLRELLQDILAVEDADALDWWCSRAMRSRLEPFKDLARTIRNHRAGIIAFLRTRVTNGLVEAINGLIQLAKRSAPASVPSRTFASSLCSKRAGSNSISLMLYPLETAKSHISWINQTRN